MIKQARSAIFVGALFLGYGVVLAYFAGRGRAQFRERFRETFAPIRDELRDSLLSEEGIGS